jgi:hypothetical protein
LEIYYRILPAEQCTNKRLAAAATERVILTVFRLWPRLADRQIAAIVRQTFQSSDCSSALLTISHGYKCESAGRAAHPIGYDLYIRDGPMWCEEIA